MEKIGKAVIHKIFGRGVVIGEHDEIITVRFDESACEKRFEYPRAFEDFVHFEEADAEAEAKQALEDKKEKDAQAQRLIEEERLNKIKEAKEALALIRKEAAGKTEAKKKKTSTRKKE